jgi:acyl carrier protein
MASTPARFSARIERQSQIAAEMKDLISKMARCDVRRIRSSSRLREDLGIDSFVGMEILVAIEGRYGIRLTDREATKLVTFGNLIRFMTRKLGKA